ncbi:probable calcium-binding protein CML43 [Amborella trichopoda]|uniref:EF-hand domain-containing protein n=1 Tax=Amborella trichopoda TaxID=13333 RepID=W1PB90_AMBTC|nr:probable calcium-binding protein CML43 [Amborella trichopoda]ERN04290.1 hypothetical protein AMTR_s00077p00177420 [Amborella trichopoda]|eukprot:XP_006842615.1 probable calcium-binding protein CML43 [Amborella trichopoda]
MREELAKATPIKSLSREASRPLSSFRLRTPKLNTMRLIRIFDIFDNNGDGEITVDELAQALDRLGLPAQFSDLESAVEGFKKPEMSGLDFDDFCALHKSLGDELLGHEDENYAGDGEDFGENGGKPSDSADLEEAFKVFDEDGDGFISAKELQIVLKKLGLPEGGEIDKVRQMICNVDQNHDGQVDFHEFKHMMRHITVPTA